MEDYPNSFLRLLLMSSACYNPNQAVDLWRRFSQIQKSPGALAKFMSTHPSHEDRISKMQQWLPEAELEVEKADCITKKMMRAARQRGYEPPADDYDD
jgi:predicted Zn-dependent protease